jgi:hypothetical protein
MKTYEGNCVKINIYGILHLVLPRPVAHYVRLRNSAHPATTPIFLTKYGKMRGQFNTTMRLLRLAQLILQNTVILNSALV